MTHTNPAFILVPGAGGSAWYWHLVSGALAEHGLDSVAVELPTDDDAAGLPEYAQSIVQAADARPDVVLVGQSMAGFSATMACARLPVSMLVLVNPMIPAPGETPGEWWANTGQPEAMRQKDVSEGRQTPAEFDVFTYFGHDVAPDLFEEAGMHQKRQSDTPFGQPWPLSAWPAVPTRVLTGRDDRFLPAEFQRRVSRDRIGVTPDEIPGGHLVALSHPKELASRLAGYLE
jgi:pimeloyl-ACP methyl ester carboxylesterase